MLLIVLMLGCAGNSVAAPPELPAMQAEERCEQALGRPTAGATVVWRTQLQLAASGVTGQETQSLLANSFWKGKEGSDCSVVYSVTGKRLEAEACPSCAYALALSMTLDDEASTCPKGLTPASESDPDWSYQVTYFVTVEGDETIVRFPSGTELGRGFSSESSLAIQTAPRCRWF